MEGFESCVEAERIVSRFYIGKGTRNVNAPSLYCVDLMAVLATAFGKILLFQVFVMKCGVRNIRKRRTGFTSIIVTSPLQSSCAIN